MKRLRAALLSAGVSIAVFTYLALPILRQWYGPAVDVVAYAGLAVVAGGLTYTLVRAVQEGGAETAREDALDEELRRLDEARDEEEIEEMLEEIDR